MRASAVRREAARGAALGLAATAALSVFMLTFAGADPSVLFRTQRLTAMMISGNSQEVGMIVRSFRSERGAVSFVQKSVPNVEAVGLPTGGGKYEALAVIRPDQEWVRDRLLERGIRVATEAEIEAALALN